MKKLADMVRKAREAQEINQIEAAKKADISVNYYRLIESGYPTHVSPGVAEKLISKLGVAKSLVRLLPQQNAGAKAQALKYRKKARQTVQKGEGKVIPMGRRKSIPSGRRKAA